MKDVKRTNVSRNAGEWKRAQLLLQVYTPNRVRGLKVSLRQQTGPSDVLVLHRFRRLQYRNLPRRILLRREAHCVVRGQLQGLASNLVLCGLRVLLGVDPAGA